MMHGPINIRVTDLFGGGSECYVVVVVVVVVQKVIVDLHFLVVG